MDQLVGRIEELYRTRYSRFRDVVATVTGPEAARDAVQEGFARALASRDGFRGEGSLEAWVWRITLRAAVELQARRRTVPANGSVIDPALVDEESDPELAAALRALPPRRRLIVFLRYFADLSYAEIAEVCGISEGTVSAALVQARRQLELTLDMKGVRQ